MRMNLIPSLLLACTMLAAVPAHALIDTTSAAHGWERPEICLPADTTYLREEAARLVGEVISQRNLKPRWQNEVWQRPVAELPGLLDLLGLYEDAEQMRNELATSSHTCMAMH